MAENNTDNIKPEGTGKNRDIQGRFIKGVSGNQAGRPKGTYFSITAEVKKKLLEVPPGEKMTYGAAVIQRIFRKAIKDGDDKMLREIWHYIDGMPMQGVDLTSLGERLDSPKVIIDTREVSKKQNE